MHYSNEILNEVRENNDIVEIVSQYMNLKRSGRNYFDLCPFYNKKSSSFWVSPDKQIFHCFGCGVGYKLILHYIQANDIIYHKNIHFIFI